MHPDNRAHFSGFSPSIREVRVDKIVHAHTVRPLLQDMPEEKCNGVDHIKYAFRRSMQSAAGGSHDLAVILAPSFFEET